MTAVFGRLQNHTLELREGLNILQAPNETGKSTWCAFLLSMLYGINSRERERAGFIPDKIRYAPWSGAVMSGRLNCSLGEQDLTITRTTRRQTSPLGDFQAVYAGTGDTISGLTGQNCGEALLGVSREVFERSAFIRQSGLPITQDAGLERRIASLITSGEEDTSYSEATDTLKKQLNRRRHNRTGQIPALEDELQEIQRQLAELEQLENQLNDARAQAEALALQEVALSAELARHDRWEAALQRRASDEAYTAFRQMEQDAAALRQKLSEERVPESEAIARLRGAIVNLETTRKAVAKARAERDEAAKILLRAEAAVNESPFAGQTAESARRTPAEPPDVRPNILPAASTSFGLLILSTLLGNHFHQPLLIGVGIAATILLYWFLYSRVRDKARHAALTKRFGTADLSEISALADAYTAALTARDAAQAALDKKSAAADTLYNTLSSNEQGILLEVRRFASAAFDIPAADEALRHCAQRRKALAQAEIAAGEARLRHELLSQQAPADFESDSAGVTPPRRSREAVSVELSEVQVGLAAARSAADRLTGQLHAVGDPVVLASSAEHLQERISALEGEYGAIQLAMTALDTANTTLQNRFSPELGRRAAEIFGELTGNRYNGVVLDRTFHLSAEPAGEAVYRDAALLSAGTADQLYLAARLAVCDLVLPAEKAVPIVLDDALSNFDDERCTAALRWLKSEAKKRQILLFTCHSREADFFAGDAEVFVQRLTDTV